MLPVYKAILPKMGVVRSIASIFRYAPKCLNGLGFPHIFIEQGCSQLKTLVSHLNTDTKLGKSMCAQLEACFIEIGSTNFLFDLDFEAWSMLLTKCWMKNIWKFTDKYSITLRGKYHKPFLQREIEVAIMDLLIALDTRHISVDALCIINRCRLYLQVLTVSDIVSTNGMSIDLGMNRQRSQADRCSKWIWPEQANPSDKEWAVWDNMVGTIISPYLASVGGLGGWLQVSHQEFRWKYSPLEDKLFCPSQSIGMPFNSYYRCDDNRRSSFQQKFQLSVTVTELPPDIVPATVRCYNQSSRVWFEGVSPSPSLGQIPIDTEASANMPDWWSDAMRRSPLEVSKLLKYCYVTHNVRLLKTQILEGHINLVSDGSYSPQHSIGTTAYRFEYLQGNILIQGVCRTPGSNSSVNAYRSELMGLYLMLLTLKIICDELKITSGEVLIWCDNLGGISMSFVQDNSPTVASKHFDILWEIHSLRNRLPIVIKHRHVQGHQSEQEQMVDRLAEINHQMDHLAKQFLTYCIQYPETQNSIDIATTRWSIWIDGEKVCQNIDHSIREYIFKELLYNYWNNRDSIDKHMK